MYLFSLLSFYLLSQINCKVHVLTDQNWNQIFQNEWMILLYAPWCPACQYVKPQWEQLSESIQSNSEISIGSIDITENAVVAGSFSVSRLPTFYHVKDGIFRQYTGDRSISSLMSFLNEKRYLTIDPVPWYYDPSSLHMRFVGHLFQLSQLIMRFQEMMSARYGWPVWLTYVLIGAVVVVVGVTISMVFMCVLDMLVPPRPQLKTYWAPDDAPPPAINTLNDCEVDSFPDHCEESAAVAGVEREFGDISLDGIDSDHDDDGDHGDEYGDLSSKKDQ